MIDPRASTALVLLALGPVGLYAIGLIDDPVAAAASTLCVFIIAGSLYLLFDSTTEDDEAHEGGEFEGA